MAKKKCKWDQKIHRKHTKCKKTNLNIFQLNVYIKNVSLIIKRLCTDFLYVRKNGSRRCILFYVTPNTYKYPYQFCLRQLILLNPTHWAFKTRWDWLVEQLLSIYLFFLSNNVYDKEARKIVFTDSVFVFFIILRESRVGSVSEKAAGLSCKWQVTSLCRTHTHAHPHTNAQPRTLKLSSHW